MYKQQQCSVRWTVTGRRCVKLSDGTAVVTSLEILPTCAVSTEGSDGGPTKQCRRVLERSGLLKRHPHTRSRSYTRGSYDGEKLAALRCCELTCREWCVVLPCGVHFQGKLGTGDARPMEQWCTRALPASFTGLNPVSTLTQRQYTCLLHPST